MGVYLSNFPVRMDTMAHVLHYPQKPLCTTRAMEFMNFRELPSGVNCIVGIACYTGYNQEDSLIFNQSSVDRGLFRSHFFRTYNKAAAGNPRHYNPQMDEQFEVPKRSECQGMRGEVGIQTTVIYFTLCCVLYHVMDDVCRSVPCNRLSVMYCDI